MTQHEEGMLSPELVMAEMKKNGVTHVVWLPDSETNFLYLLMEADPDLDLIPVSREGQAFSTAAGLTVGGKKPVILIQNTGMMESGDSLRGLGPESEHPSGHDGGLPGLDPPRRKHRHCRHLHRAVPECLRNSILFG